MKTLMKQGVVLAAVLLVATMLVTGCTPEPSGSTPPAGTGLVRLGLGLDNVARATFLPETTLADFEQFDLTLIPDTAGPTTAGSSSATIAWTGGTVSNTFTWGLGDYILTIVAYTTETTGVYGSATGPAATAVEAFTVVAGSNTVDITLKAYAPGDTQDEGEGKFAWVITNTDLTNIATATMTLTVIGGAQFASYNLNGGSGLNVWANTAGVDIPAGFYNVDFVIIAGTPATTRYLRHVVHIYENHTTTVRYSFSKDKLGIIDTSVVVTIIEFEPPAEIQPEVQYAVGGDPAEPVDEGDAITVTLGTDTTVLSLANASDYISTTIEWRFDGKTIPGATCTVDTITAGSAFIVPAGRYPLSVSGRTPLDANDPYAGAWYSTEIFIIFVEP
jgi:hypothetical protein